ncbi:MAG: hypothetical protein WCK05_17165, partial [Planctomycetota bacterium]
MNTRSAVTSFVVLLALAAQSAQGASVTWTGGKSGNWSAYDKKGKNWDVSAPGAGDDVFLN